MTRTIAFDLRCLSISEKSERGTGQVVRPLLESFARDTGGFQFVLLHVDGQDVPDLGKSFKAIEVPGEYGDISRPNWHQESCKLGRFLSQLDVDLYHSPDLYFPRGFNKPVLVTINDYYELPLFGPFEMFGKRYAWRWNLRFRFRYEWTWRTLRKWCTKIATISDTTATRIKEGRPLLADKVVSIPIGLLDGWNEPPKQASEIISTFDFPRPWILHTGGFEFRKNPEGIVQAFQEIRDHYPEATLLLTGPDHGVRPNLEGIEYLGYVDLPTLKSLYMAADCFLFPSFEEGFGIPVLEALSFGCPVVTSTGTATEEAADGKAILVDPGHSASI
ncbi:MAG: glycosyltransferase family 4 protein, partial [Candidatus Lindowbacteria bacterium]|nr:glycosyltransferase family 4 protein [Candidatus Lindowbacteria bacterium]